MKKITLALCAFAFTGFMVQAQDTPRADDATKTVVKVEKKIVDADLDEAVKVAELNYKAALQKATTQEERDAAKMTMVQEIRAVEAKKSNAKVDNDN